MGYLDIDKRLHRSAEEPRLTENKYPYRAHLPHDYLETLLSEQVLNSTEKKFK